MDFAAPTPLAGSQNADFVLLNGFLVFFMQAGFVALESGHVRAKNVRNILLKNMVNVMLCAICWWATGYAFAYGKTAGGILGVSQFFTSGESSTVAKPWFFTWTFSLSTITIISGCLAERTQVFAYPVFTTIVSTLVHPVVAHWVWAEGSWMGKVNSDCRFLDFAGGSVVHLVGGLTGLVGAIVCGPRLGRFEDGVGKDIPGHDMSSVSLGTFMLWFGWFGFNCGSTYLYIGDTASAAHTVNRVALNMTLTASTAGLTALVVASFKSGTFDLVICCNGLLSGLAASTAIVGFIHPWAACVTGTLAGLFFVLNSRLLLRLGIDDPLDSSIVHCGSGILGCILTGFLARPMYVKALTGQSCGGVVYAHQGWLQLGLQVLGICVTATWTVIWALAIFLGLKHFNVLRVSLSTELAGIDNIEHGGPAYPEFVSRNLSRT